MTEAEWLGADSPLGMLGWLCEGRHYLRRGPVSDRKLRLFACACCRAVWHLLRDKRSRRAVEAAERLADGRVPGGEAVRVWAAAAPGALSGLAWQCTCPSAEECAWNAVHRLRCDGRLPRVDTAALLREVVGNPFRAQLEMASAVRHDPVPLSWLTPEVRAGAAGATTSACPPAPWTRSGWPSWRTRWRTAGATAAPSWGTCARRARTTAGAGRST